MNAPGEEVARFRIVYGAPESPGTTERLDELDEGELLLLVWGEAPAAESLMDPYARRLHLANEPPTVRAKTPNEVARTWGKSIGFPTLRAMPVLTLDRSGLTPEEHEVWLLPKV